MSDLEEVRKANEGLRDWGREIASVADDKIDELEADLKEAKETAQ